MSKTTSFTKLKGVVSYRVTYQRKQNGRLRWSFSWTPHWKNCTHLKLDLIYRCFVLIVILDDQLGNHVKSSTMNHGDSTATKVKYCKNLILCTLTFCSSDADRQKMSATSEKLKCQMHCKHFSISKFLLWFLRFQYALQTLTVLHCMVWYQSQYILLNLKTDNLYPIWFQPFFYIMVLFPFLPNYEKLLDSINFNVILHYFLVVYFHKCRKNLVPFRPFSTFMISCSTFFDRFHPRPTTMLQHIFRIEGIPHFHCKQRKYQFLIQAKGRRDV
jgi:hypothetical protein